MKTTPWFDMSVEPVRDGVYELIGKKSRVIFYARFWRGYWRSLAWTHQDAARQRAHSMNVILGHVKAWRGLAERPE